MFERIVNFIKGAINKMFNTTDIAKNFNIDISTSNEVLSAIEKWSNIYNSKAPWLNEEVKSLKSQITEKDAIISALSKLTGKNSSDVDKYVRMAKGLVDENTSIDQALEQVLDFLKVPEQKPIPSGKPLNEPNSTPTVENPFSSGNLTKQGEMIKSDREKAREMYFKAKGAYPSW